MMNNPLKRAYPLDTKKLVDLLMENELTQDELARKTRISKANLSRIMNGQPAYRKTITRIARALGVEDIQELIVKDSPREKGKKSLTVIEDVTELEALVGTLRSRSKISW
jgi:transcriptional regulator with XRE-family HTH domain